MKTGVSIFIAAFVALGASWLGLVYAPVLQLGGAKQTVVLQSTESYPLQRPGEATLGAQVYRANGCTACHSQQVRQQGVATEITLTDLGAHKPADLADFIKSLSELPELAPYKNSLNASLKDWNGGLPKTLWRGADQDIATEMADRLKAVGVKSETRIVATGADIARGWGSRQSVAADYLYDTPVQLGSLRAGPDLANIGVRAPDVNWQLQHLYAPRSIVKNSTMPAFRYLFTVQKISAQPAPDALVLPKEFAPAEGLEVVPTAEAKQLAAYLVSLKSNVPLYEAPFTPIISTK
jgi:cbb3-type cytochrome oxidase cytochrome c subunit